MIDARLRLLQMVDQLGTVTGAAQALHYTPSAASYQLRQLGAEHDVRLMEPHGRGIRLTAAAHILLRHAAILSAQAERARAELAAAADEPGGIFTLCGFSTAATHLLPPAAARLRDEQPEVDVRVIEAEPARCLDLLMTGDADIALVVSTAATPSESDPRFEQQPLFDDPLDLIVPADHPFTRRRRVTLRDTRKESWILGRPDSTYHHLVDAACEASGFSPDVAHYADEWDTGAALVAQHFGIILVPRLARMPNDLAVARIPLHGDPAPTRRVISMTRRGSSQHPLVANVLEEMANSVADLFGETLSEGSDQMS
jgi:DNA-binding transcriptional LysR family regulator